jgi:glycosyltransferase involved in cell wall biosynthesis
MEGVMGSEAAVEEVARARRDDRPVPLLLVGNFLSGSVGTRAVGEDLADRLRDAGWPVLATSTKVGKLARLSDMLATVWHRRHDYAVAQVDVFSGNAFVWAEVVCGALAAARKPVILVLHGGNLPAFARRWPGRVRRLLGAAAVVVAPSPYLLVEMRKYREDLELLPNPLAIERYPFRLRSDPEPSIVWLRALHKIYNPSLVARVVAELAADHREVRAAMFGPDNRDGSAEALLRLARAVGVADRVVLRGGVPKRDVPSCLAEGDIFLNTANVDNTPVSVLEAMACGLCVVTTRVGGVPYILEDGHDALLVPPDDAPAMADAVRRILADRALAARLSRNARRKVERFDWSAFLPEWERLVSEAMRRAHPPAALELGTERS